MRHTNPLSGLFLPIGFVKLFTDRYTKCLALVATTSHNHRKALENECCRRCSPRPQSGVMTGILGRIWLPVLIVVAATVGGYTVANVRTVFGSNPVIVVPESSDSAKSFNPKIVTYEVFGTGSTAVVNYLDLNGKPQRVPDATLPWSLTLRTTTPAVTPNIIAQSDGHAITCRVTVDNEVKDERTVTGADAETFCLVKSA